MSPRLPEELGGTSGSSACGSSRQPRRPARLPQRSAPTLPFGYPLAVDLLPSSTVRVFAPPTCGFQCSALWFMLTPNMASADFCMSLPTPCDVSSTGVALGTHADLPGYCAPTFTLMPVGFTSQPSVQVLDFGDNRHLIRLRRLVSASCSSGQRFAFSFLQIRSRLRHPCRSANSSPCRASRGLSPPSECALPGAPKKSPTRAGGAN